MRQTFDRYEEPAIWEFEDAGLVNRRAASEWYRKVCRLRTYWPRLCACGREFRGPQAQSWRCPTCRKASVAGR
jgi:hypothetical protein